MEQAVRAALWIHLEAQGGPPAPAEARDPNHLLPVAQLAAAMARFAGRRGPGALQALGRDYAALWGRTFRTLCRHLQGRPEQALRILASEVYPFLRGDRRAARLDEAEGGRGRLTLAAGLPDEYLCGLVEGFVALSGASATCQGHGAEAFDVDYRVAPSQWLARGLLQASAMRLPFLVSALLAALLGIAASGTFPTRAWVVLAGTVAAQAAANALHDLRGRREGGPFDAPILPRWLVVGSLGAGYGGAATCAVYLSLTGTPAVALWALGGLGLSLLYMSASERGLGPFLAGFTYGPLVATGALHALVGWSPEDAYLSATLASLPVGALAAAMVYMDDLADSPLDEAAGRRTLVVRLPRRSHVVGYALLAGVGAAGVLAAAWWRLGPYAMAALAAPLAAALLVLAVARHVHDPRGLAPARAGTLGFQLAAALAIIRFVWVPT